MKRLTAMLCTALLAAAPLVAQAQEKKDPSPAQKKQQERMKDCNARAADKKMEGDARKKYMSACLAGKGEAAEKGGRTPQQEKMAACNKQASSKGMKGDDRKKYMSDCLKG